MNYTEEEQQQRRYDATSVCSNRKYEPYIAAFCTFRYIVCMDLGLWLHADEHSDTPLHQQEHRQRVSVTSVRRSRSFVREYLSTVLQFNISMNMSTLL